MDNSQKDKQQYLFQQIIQKNYDPEQFQEYILQAKEGGDDLDNWPFQELKQAVQKFQKMCNKEEPENEGKSVEVERRKTVIDEYLDIEQSPSKSKYQDSNSRSDGPITDESFNCVIKCNTLAPSSLFNAKNVNVIVTKFEKKEGGLFEQSYVSYFIQTPFLNKTVDRRYSDFQWLKATLQWLHPGIPIPPIAKKGQFRRYDDKHLRKRMMILEMFLNKLLQIPDLRAQPLVEQFLTLTDKASFEKMKANYKTTGKLIPLREIKTTKGTVVSAADKKINTFLVGAQRHLQYVQPMVKSFYKDFKAAATQLEACGATLKNLGSKCETIDQIQRKFRKDHEINYCPNNFYTILSEAVGRLAQQLLNQALIFRTQFYSLIKYDSLYMLNLVDNFQMLSGIQEKFQVSKNHLLKKKDKLYTDGNVEKWDLDHKVDRSNRRESMAAMLPKENKKLQKVRDVYGLYNFEMYEEIQRYFATKNQQQGIRLQQCCKNQTRLCSEMMMIWVDAETNIMGMKENKSVIKC